jgi:2-keto-3-deoxy-6-phosphogluconate aldolase
MTVPGAMKVIYDLTRQSKDIVVAAGTVFDLNSAQRVRSGRDVSHEHWA